MKPLLARAPLAALAFGAMLCGPVHAQVAPTPAPTPADPCGSILSIVNRPAFGTGVCTVRRGGFDIETGYTNTVTTGAGGGATAVAGQALLRLGTGDSRFDVEFALPSIARTDVGGAVATGTTDLGIGVKYELGYSGAALWGANLAATLPTGSPGFSAGRTQLSGGFNWAYTLDPTFALSGTLGGDEFAGVDPSGVARSYFAFMPTLALTAAIPGSTPQQLTVEYAYFSAAGPGLGGRSWIDGIYQRDLSPHLQVDVEYGSSPTAIGGQTQHYVGAGLSFMR